MKTEYVPCGQCGVLIPGVTAQRTQGFCIPCKMKLTKGDPFHLLNLVKHAKQLLSPHDSAADRELNQKLRGLEERFRDDSDSLSLSLKIYAQHEGLVTGQHVA